MRPLLAVVLSALLALPLLAACGKTIGDNLEDVTITTRVTSALLNEPDVLATRIDVSTSAGVVTLSGAVKSKDEENRVIQVARQVPGVKEVKSTLRIQQPPSSPSFR